MYLSSIIETFLLMLPALLVVAYVTVAERKTMASMQRRLGPNAVGYYGLLQAFADALKLILKEYVAPTQSNLILFFLGPIVTLLFALVGYAVIPYGPGLTLGDLELGILFLLAVSSLATYGILLAGWSANSKYAFLGSLRSTAQLISYELVLSSILLIVIMITKSLNLNINIQFQKIIWLIVPLFYIFIVFFIGSVAETNRAPFDLAEAESELVSGFMTEHAAVIFVFFFLAEYASIVLMCIFTSILFLGGYYFNIDDFIVNITIIFKLLALFLDAAVNTITALIWGSDLHFGLSDFFGNFSHYFNTINYQAYTEVTLASSEKKSLSLLTKDGLVSSLVLGIKSSLMVFVFIWVRASFPRIRFDQLMSFCWTVLLPLLFAFIFIIPCILHLFKLFLVNSYIF